MTVPNPELRQHVQRVGFDLSLSKNQIAALVVIAEHYAKETEWSPDIPGHIHARCRPWTTFVMGMAGLHARGLAWHRSPAPQSHTPGCEIYGLTTAGHYVVGLLSEAGIWQEYIDQLDADAAAGIAWKAARQAEREAQALR